MIQKFIHKFVNSLLISLPLLLLLQYLFRFSSTDFNVPMSFEGDALLSLAAIKTMLESGWVFYFPKLGAPFGSNVLDFPGADNFFFLLIKTLTLALDDPFLILNVFYVLGFVLIYFSTYWASRKFQVNQILSIAIAIVFTIAPYHFFRNLSHLFLATYFIVPLIIVVIVDLTYGVTNSISSSSNIRAQHLLILVLAGTSGIYYAFFSILFFLFLCSSSFVESRKVIVIKNGLIGSGLILLVSAINVIPNLIYKFSAGTNHMVAKRAFIESEIYGLKLTQLILPIWGHRYDFFAALNQRYREAMPITEASSSSLGILGSAGFFLLLIIILLGIKVRVGSRLEALARLNLFAFLFSTVGGLGALFAFFVTPEFRGLNRVSIFILFFSVLSLIIVVEALIYRCINSSDRRHQLSFIVGIAIITIAIYDQIPVGAVGQNQEAVKNFYSEKDFFNKIEAEIPEGAMVYQYPYIQFPEAAPLNREGYNAYLKPYLLSTTLRWSHGAIKGRPADAWNEKLASLMPKEQIQALSDSGFSGILINNLACGDSCRQMVEEVKQVSISEPLVSSSGTYIFYKLAIRQGVKKITPTYSYSAGAGFYAPEVDKNGNQWNWAQKSGILNLYNFLDAPYNVVLNFSITPVNSNQLSIAINNHDRNFYEFKSGVERRIDLPITLNPGLNYVKIDSGSPTIKIFPDARDFGFRISNIRIFQIN